MEGKNTKNIGKQPLLKYGKKYQILFENIADSAVLVDLSGRVADINQTASRFFGYSKKEFLKLSIRQLHPASQTKKIMNLFRCLVKNKLKGTIETEIMTRNKKIKPISLNVSRIKLDDKIYLLGLFRDLSQQTAAELHYKTLSELAQDNIYVVDKTGTVIYVNKFGAKQFKANPSELVGKNIKNLFPSNTASRQKKNLNKVFKTGQSMYLENLSIFPSGPTWLSTQLTPIKDRGGRVQSVMGLSRDISERYIAEAEIKKETSLLNSITSTSSEGILVIARQGQVVFYNNRFLDLWKIPNKLIRLKDDKKLLAYVVGQLADPKEFLAKVNYLYQHASLSSFDQINLKDGQVFERLSVPQKIDNKIVGRVWRFRDITEYQKARDGLVLSEQKYRRLFEAAKDGILILDAKTGEIREVNPYLIEMLGYNHKEFLQKKLWQIGLFKDIVNSKKAFEVLKRKKYIHYENLPLRTKAGRPISVEFVSNVYLIDHAEVIQCNIRDITARHDAETKVINNEARFRAIFENSPIAIVLVGLDNYFVSANLAAVKLWGYSEAELKKMTFVDITHPAEVQRDVIQTKRLLRGEIDVYNADKRYVRKDKAVIFGRINVTLVKDFEHKPLYFLTIIEDVTEHHQWEETIRKSEEKYSTFIEQSSDGVLVIQDGLIKFANKTMQDMVGFSPADFLNKSMLEFIGPKYKKYVAEQYSRRMRGLPAPKRYEFQIVKKDGQLLFVETNSSIIDYEGRPADMAIIRDVSKAREIDRAKSEFISVASHQLRGPLTGIKWFSQLLVDQKVGKLTEKQIDFIRQIYDSNERMIRLVNDLLDVSHIETGQKFFIEKQRQDIIALINKVIEDQKINSPVKNINIELDKSCPAKLIFSFDQDKIYQVFSNLINNSIKYSSQNKKIIIGLKCLNDKVEFFVKDFGFGIPQHQKGRVFQKFFRADNIATISTDGTGLGLYIAKSIVDAHGGKIWFESKQNKGTTFYFILPLKSKKNHQNK
ncbi:MAG: PAS domain S-box protein [Patescibacteria group bacterium]